MQIKGLRGVWKADIVCLQETKLQVVKREVVQSWWSCARVDWYFLGSRGASKGILLIWDRRVVEKMEACEGRFISACSFLCVSDNFEWVSLSVQCDYGHNDDQERKLLWDELVGVMSWWEKPWCIGGDFNIIRYPSERLGDNRYSSSMGEFSDFIFEQGLMDSLNDD